MYFQKLTPILILTALSLSGCASTSTQMVNENGQAVNCGASGFGLIGAPAALVMTQNCIDKHKAAGYREAGEPPTTTQTKPAQTNAPTLNPVTVSSKDNHFKITLPAGWVQTTPTGNQQLTVKNPTADVHMLITTANLADVTDWRVFAETQRKRLASNLSQSTTSEVENVKINGAEALRADISGTLKSGLKVHYLGTIIKTDKQIIQVLAWSVASKFSENRKEFEKIASSIEF
jgi:hypothetical protein